VFDFFKGIRFRPFVVPEEIAVRLAQIEAGKRRILCAPDVFERIRDAVYGDGGNADYVVLENRWLKDGQVILAQPEAEQEAELQVAGQRMMDELVERWGQQQRAEWRAQVDGLHVYRSGLRSWIAPGL